MRTISNAAASQVDNARFTRLLIIIVTLCAVIILPHALAQILSADVTTIRLLRNPEALPEFTLKTVDGKTVSSGEWRGKVVLVNFWATWCPPCLDEIPYLIKLQSKYGDHLQIIGFSLDSGSPESVNASIRRFVQQQGINYPVAIAAPELQNKFGGILGLPTTFLLDDHGRVVQKHVGVVNPGLYEAEIRALLGLPVGAKIEYVADNGQIFSTNKKSNNQVPGVDLSKLTPEQQDSVLQVLSKQMCPCNCRMTLKQCRIIDPACPTSLTEAKRIASESRAKSETQQVGPSQ